MSVLMRILGSTLHDDDADADRVDHCEQCLLIDVILPVLRILCISLSLFSCKRIKRLASFILSCAIRIVGPLPRKDDYDEH